MKNKIEKANQILAWMARKCKKNRSVCPCINGVKSTDLLAYLKRYHSDLTDWIHDSSNDPEERDFVWIETGLLEQLVEMYLDVKVVWNKELVRYEAVGQ